MLPGASIVLPLGTTSTISPFEFRTTVSLYGPTCPNLVNQNLQRSIYNISSWHPQFILWWLSTIYDSILAQQFSRNRVRMTGMTNVTLPYFTKNIYEYPHPPPLKKLEGCQGNICQFCSRPHSSKWNNSQSKVVKKTVDSVTKNWLTNLKAASCPFMLGGLSPLHWSDPILFFLGSPRYSTKDYNAWMNIPK